MFESGKSYRFQIFCDSFRGAKGVDGFRSHARGTLEIALGVKAYRFAVGEGLSMSEQTSEIGRKAHNWCGDCGGVLETTAAEAICKLMNVVATLV